MLVWARVAKRAREQTAEAEQKRIKAQFYEQKQQIHNKLDRSALVAKMKENQGELALCFGEPYDRD